MRRFEFLLSCTVPLLMLALPSPAAAQKAPPEMKLERKGDKDEDKEKEGPKGPGFDLKKFETQAVDSTQLRKMEEISSTRQDMIKKLEKLLRDRPLYPRKAEVFFRLGEYYWQESKYQYLKSVQAYDDAMEAFENKTLQVEPTAPKEDFEAALQYYRKVINQFPDYARIDEVMFYLGRGALQQGKEAKNRALVKEGVQYFQKLVQNYPRSRFIAQAHLALGEHFFETDSLYYAKTNYEKIINNFPKSPMYNYALYKLGWVYFNLREFRRTVDTFQKVIANIGAKKGQVSFRDQALGDLVKTYAEMDDSWHEALDYFKEVLEKDDLVYARMEVLATLYMGFDKDKEALELFNHFIDRTPSSPKVTEWLASILDVKKKVNDFGAIEKVVRRILETFEPEGRWMIANKGNQEAIDEANGLGERNLLWLANHWHVSAEKAEKLRKKEFADDMFKRAARDYKIFLDRFPASKQAYLISFYYAEILYHKIENYEESLRRYQAVIELDKKGKFVEDAALGVIYSSYELMCRAKIRECGGGGRGGAGDIAVQKLNKKELEEVKKEEKKITKTDLHELEKAYVSAADQYVNLLLTLRKDPEFVKKFPKRGERIPEIMYMAAETFYRHGQFKDAVSRLNKIFEYDANHKYGAIAAVTLIRAYARLRRWSRVEEWARALIKKRNFKFQTKDQLEEYIAIAISEHAIDLSKQRKHGEAIAESKRLIKEFRKKKKLVSKALMNMAVLYERAKDIKAAVKTYERVIREFKKEDVAPEAQYVIGVIYESQTRFEDSAVAFTKMQKFKKHKDAPNAISNAGLIREAMQNYKGAIKAFELWLKLFPKHDEAADVYFKIALLNVKIAEEETGKKRVKAFEAAAKLFQKFATKYPTKYVMKVTAYSRAGDLLRRLDVESTAEATEKARSRSKKKDQDDLAKIIKKVYKNRKRATTLFEQALMEYPKAVQQVAALRGTEKIAKGAEAKAYAAQAAYWLADYVFQDFDDSKIAGTLRPKVLKDSLIKKAELHQKAEKAFDQVLNMGDAGWLACAAFRNGLLYYNFAKELFEVPIPFGLSQQAEDEYRAILEEMGAPIQEKALLLLKAALGAAHQKGVYNKCAKDAGIYAHKVSPEEYPVTGDDQLSPRHTKDTLLSANFIRTLKRKDVVVDMLKKTTKDLEAEKKD